MSLKDRTTKEDLFFLLKKASKYELGIYLFLLSRSTPDMSVEASCRAIASHLKVSVNTILKYCASLEEKKLLVRESKGERHYSKFKLLEAR
jgi:DNA-binding IclR family transcriptional regulator